jgi:hypothetical protein
MTTPEEKEYVMVYHPVTFQWIGMHEMEKKKERRKKEE